MKSRRDEWHAIGQTKATIDCAVSLQSSWRVLIHAGMDRIVLPLELSHETRPQMKTDPKFGTVASQLKTVVLLMNPRAGAKSAEERVTALRQQLESRGLNVLVLKDLEEMKRVADSDSQLRCVVACGGDGTAAAVVNRTAPDTPIVTFPLGTENVLAKYLQVSGDPETVAEMIIDGKWVQLDVGKAGDRLFLLHVGCGFDADVVRRLHNERTGHIQRLSYAKPIIQSIRKYPYPELMVKYDPRLKQNDTHTGLIRCRWAFVVNLPRYAGGLEFVPEAVGTDGLLDICTFRSGSLWSGLWYLGSVLFGRHRQSQDCITVQTTRVRLESSGQVPYQLDGDPGGFLPVDIEIVPARLRLVVPAQWLNEQQENGTINGVGNS